MDGVELDFTPAALGAIAKMAIARNTGARGLRSIIEGTINDIMFEIPGNDDIAKVIVTEETVNGTAEPELVYKDKE